jgi:dethiobiotin synthase
VTGTDTGVGKTVVSAALLHRFRARSARYWKPVQTGTDEDDDTATVLHLSGRPSTAVLEEGVRLPRPVSPHLAARLNGSRIDVDLLLAVAGRQSGSGSWIVEGAGGVLVPLNDDSLVIDLIGRLGLPVLIVSRSGLGTINHTLLTIEALGRRGMRVAGIVMVGAPDAENRRAIERYGSVPVLGELPRLDPLAPDALQGWAEASLDSEGRLAGWMA